MGSGIITNYGLRITDERTYFELHSRIFDVGLSFTATASRRKVTPAGFFCSTDLLQSGKK